MNGYNPLTWDCEQSGCFNIKRRPKIEEFAECFPGKIAMGDVDGIVEMKGKFLLLEWKCEGGLRQAQEIMYKKFTAQPGNLVLVVAGNAETMEVHHFRKIRNGQMEPWCRGDLQTVKGLMRQWAAECSHAA